MSGANSSLVDVVVENRACSSALVETRIMGADSARAVGRFKADGPDGYRAATAPGALLRSSRAAAVEDERTWLDA